MPVAWRTDYAIRLVYELARLGADVQESIGTVAERAEVPYDFARQIANRLAREGLLVSRRGAKGGFALARPAEQITLLDIFTAMDEKPTLSLCTHVDNACSRSEWCPAHAGVWEPLDVMIADHLRASTIAGAVTRGIELGREDIARS
ncbi:MAG TPA: Rrf2 family transcriptional regulator [Coriobacteriia bacterium]|nr:Rrf2 family transcriptional regulator [Coriobacteriia bacterium]